MVEEVLDRAGGLLLDDADSASTASCLVTHEEAISLVKAATKKGGAPRRYRN